MYLIEAWKLTLNLYESVNYTVCSMVENWNKCNQKLPLFIILGDVLVFAFRSELSSSYTYFSCIII